MKPPMKQQITAHVPTLDAAGKPIPDKYGRPQTSEVTSKAAVRKKINLLRDSQGTETRTNLEIDIPKELILDAGTSVDYVDVDGRQGKAVVVDSENITNLTNSKVYYRTVYANG